MVASRSTASNEVDASTSGQAIARDHQLARGAAAEAQRPVQADLLERFQQAAVAAFGDQQLDLVGRVHVAMAGGADADQLEQQDAAAVEERDRPGEDLERPLHRQHSQDRHASGVLKGQRLGHQLAEDHRQHRQHQQDGDRCGGQRRVRIEPGHPFEQRCDARRQAAWA